MDATLNLEALKPPQLFVHLLLLCTAFLVASTAQTTVLPTVLWTKSNSQFQQSNGCPLTLQAYVGYLINFTCPDTSTGEQYLIYVVDATEFYACARGSSSDVLVLDCSTSSSKRTVSFVVATQQPPGSSSITFTIAQNKYFATTSSTSDVNNLSGGACSAYNLRAVVQVLDSTQSSTPPPVTCSTTSSSSALSSFSSSRTPAAAALVSSAFTLALEISWILVPISLLQLFSV